MKIKTYVYRMLNRALKPTGLVIKRTSAVFENRLTDDKQLNRLFVSIADKTEKWMTNQAIFKQQSIYSVCGAIQEFYEAYLKCPFRSADGGSGFNNLLWLFLIARSARPDIIIDSGTFSGASAWALRLGCPSARVLSFDIDLSRLIWRAEGVEYYEQDWFSFDTGSRPSNILAYFDDHTDQARRLIQAQERGVGVALFDDDFSVFQFPDFAHGGSALPKLEFITDDSLKSVESISFIENGTHQIWKIDHEYLMQARQAIRAIDRLPDTSSIAGYSQLPYRIVRINQHTGYHG